MTDNTQSIANEETFPKLWCPEFLLWFSYVGTINGITDNAIDFNLQRPPTEVGLVQYDLWFVSGTLILSHLLT